MWAQSLDWGPDGYLYVGTFPNGVQFGDANAKDLAYAWYMLDPAADYAIVDSFGTAIDYLAEEVDPYVYGCRDWDCFNSAGNAIAVGDTLFAPRGAAWTVTGDTMYTADYNGDVVKLWTAGVGGWEFDSDLTHGPSPHGVVVTPDGRIWVGYYADTDTLFGAGTPPADTTLIAPIYVFNADGTPSDTIQTITVAATTDTIATWCRGLSLDHEGNVLFVGSGVLYRLDYTDGSGLDKYVFPTTGSMAEAAADTFGFTYVTRVGATVFLVLDENLDEYEVVDTLATLQRTVLASPDGNDLYVGNIYSALDGIIKYHSDNGADGPYAIVDTLGTIFHYEESVTVDSTALGVDPITGLPQEYALAQNFPNPFNPRTWITYEIPTTELVSLTVYNLLGQKVRTLVNDVQIAGAHSLVWEGTNDKGIRLPSGIYVYRLETNSTTLSRKMVMMK
jgi:hypothetical protein